MASCPARTASVPVILRTLVADGRLAQRAVSSTTVQAAALRSGPDARRPLRIHALLDDASRFVVALEAHRCPSESANRMIYGIVIGLVAIAGLVHESTMWTRAVAVILVGAPRASSRPPGRRGTRVSRGAPRWCRERSSPQAHPLAVKQGSPRRHAGCCASPHAVVGCCGSRRSVCDESSVAAWRTPDAHADRRRPQ